MDSQTSAALIAALAAGGVAVVGFITNLRTTTRTLDAARDQRLWEKQAEVYEEILAFCAYRQTSRQRIISLGDSPDTQAGLQRLLGSYEPPSWFQMQARVIAFGSAEVEQAFRNARDADEACAVAQLAAFRAAQAGDLTDDRAGKILELAIAAEAADNWLATIAHDPAHSQAALEPTDAPADLLGSDAACARSRRARGSGGRCLRTKFNLTLESIL